jgi:hypothetical protein
MLRLLGVQTGENAPAPRNVIPGRGLHQNYGHWGFTVAAIGSPMGATLHIPCRPRDRVGFRGPAGQYARRQRQRHVHRIPGYALDRRGFYGAAESRATNESRLFRETHRARPGDGGGRGAFGNRKSEALSGASFFSFRQQALTPRCTEGHHFAVTHAICRLDGYSRIPSRRGRICRKQVCRKQAAVVSNQI